MPEINMKAKELGDANVSFISLVKRPANRVPFRITKSDDLINPEGSDFMFNLSTVFKGKDSEKDAKPSVVAIAIKKEDSEKMIPILIEKGFKTEDQIERDDVLILKQEDSFNEEDLVAFKMDESVVAMVSNVKKMFSTFTNSMSFADNLASQGFMPGIFVATDALIETFHNILFGSDNADEVRTKMAMAITEYSAFVTAMATNLPEIVFKLEADAPVSEVIKTESTETGSTEDETVIKDEDTKTTGATDEQTQEKAAKTEEVKTEVDTETVAKTADEIAAAEAAQITEAVAGDIDKEILNPSVTKGDDESGADTETTDKVADESTVSKGDTGQLMTLLTAIQKQLNDGLEGVNGKLEEVEKSNTELSDRLNTVEEVAKSAKKAVDGTVLSGSDAVRSEGLGNQSRTMKNDNTEEDLWEDTALDNILS